MNSHIQDLFNEPVVISSIDGLPIHLYIIEFGFVDTIFYDLNKYWNTYYPVGIRLFINFFKAYDFYKNNIKEIIGRSYMKLYDFMDDGDKEILFFCHGGKVGKRNIYV